MAYYREAETARMLENHQRWGGDRPGVRSSASVWDRLVRELRRSEGIPIPTLAAEALQTKRALAIMPERGRAALVNYHTTSKRFAIQMLDARLSETGLRMLLHRSHSDFWSSMNAICIEDQKVRECYRESTISVCGKA